MKKFLARFKIPETGCSRILNYEVQLLRNPRVLILRTVLISSFDSFPMHSQPCTFKKRRSIQLASYLKTYWLMLHMCSTTSFMVGWSILLSAKHLTAIYITISHIAWQGTSAVSSAMVLIWNAIGETFWGTQESVLPS